MSPEQMRSTRDVDARADVWALGAVIHELVAGEPPFDAETMTALCAAILQDPPKPIRLSRPDVPPQLEAVVRGALEKDRDRRFQNVAQLAMALAPFGSPSARASAERIARVLGVPAGAMPQPTAVFDPRASSPAFSRPSPMAATTGGSGSITADVPRRSSPGALIAVGVAAFLVLAIGGGVGLVAWKRHAAPEGAAAASAPPTASSPVVTPPTAPPPAVSLADPAPTAAPTTSTAAAPSASAPSSSGSAAQTGAAPTAAPPAGHPGWPPRHPPGVGGQPPAGAPAPTRQQPPPSNNPFGDDRRG
jgi:serine/threonine-protein kinase